MFKEKKAQSSAQMIGSSEAPLGQAESPETVRRSVKERLLNFFSQDQKIDELITKTDLHNPATLAEIKEEIKLEPTLAEINAEARDLELDTLDSLSELSAEESEEEKFYQQELLPLLKVLVPADTDFSAYEASMLEQLKQRAEILQDRSGRAAASNELTNLREMKSLLLARCHQTVSEQEKLFALHKRQKQKESFDLNPLKQAKIALMAGGDFSLINRNQGKLDQYGPEKMPTASTLFSHLHFSEYGHKPASPLSIPEISALMKAGMTDHFLELELEEQRKYFQYFSDELLCLMVSRDKLSANEVDSVLGDKADPQGYSRETFKYLLSCRHEYALSKFLTCFEKNISADDVKSLILRYSPDYPFHANDLAARINVLSWPEEIKDELVDFIVLHNLIDSHDSSSKDKFLEALSPAQRAKYEPICDDIKNLGTIPGHWDRYKPENLPEEKMKQMRQHIETGHLSMIHYDYIKYFLKNDYDWILGQALSYGQEKLFLSFSQALRPQDQQRYAEKLLVNGDIDILNRQLSSRGGIFSHSCLSVDIYKQLLAEGYVPPFAAFSHLDEEILTAVQEKKPQLLRGKDWYDNVEKASLSQDNFLEQKKYQEIIAFVRSYFKSAPEDLLYKELNLNSDVLQNSDLETFKAGIQANTEVFRQHYQKILKEDEVLSDEDLAWAIEAFCKNTGYDLYLWDADRLATFLENSRLTPQTLAGNRTWFRRSTEAIASLPVERKQIESANFGKIFSSNVSPGEFLNDRDSYFDNFKFLSLRHEFDDESSNFFRSFFKEMRASSFLKIKKESFWKKQALDSPADKEHWAEKFLAYVNVNENVISLAEADKKKIDDLFSGPYKDECLLAFQEEWSAFLNSQKEHLTLPLAIVSETVDRVGGAGNLKHFEALSVLANQIREAYDKPQTTPRTKQEINKMLAQQEERFEKDKWSQNDRSNFYNLSANLIAAAPSIFAAFTPVFEKLSGKEIKTFSKELLPLYQAELIILQDTNKAGETVYKPRDLVHFRTKLEFLAARMKLYPEDKELAITEERERLTTDVATAFKERFGLYQFPQDLKKEDLRTLTNYVRYIGNINDRDDQKESILSLFLSLELKKEWSDFRSDKEIDFKKHLVPEKLKLISKTLEGKKNNALSPEILGIEKDELLAFQGILQKETKNSMIGSLETIDVKVGKIKNSLMDLTDPDAYNDPIDKSLLSLQSSAGKQVGATLAKIYNNLEGRPVVFSEAEQAIQKELAQLFRVSAWDQVTVKKIQDRVQPFNLLSNLLKKIGVDENIKELRRRLLPSAAVTAIFNRLDEAFKSDSGAYASFKDLEYLESQVVKEESQLQAEEKKLIKDYLQGIKEKMLDLEKISSMMGEYFDKIKNSFDNLTKAEPERSSSLLASRLQELDKIVHSTGEGMIVSRVTNDMNFIIENMRQCLGCLHKEANNDTNLAFGDFNKFFMMSEQEKRSGSVADEIVFFVPLENAQGKKEMTFVMDQVYGSKSADILLAHTLAVHKKYSALKDKFPQAKISITVTDAALSSVGIDATIFIKKMKEKLGDDVNFEILAKAETEKDSPDSSKIAPTAKVNIPSSSFSDNYIEFGGGSSRKSGERVISGLLIR